VKPLEPLEPDVTRIKWVDLTDAHAPTGRTEHYRASLLPPPVRLEIVQLEGAVGFYLLYLDAQGNEQTDTFHETLPGALAQAEFEFRVRPDEWTDDY
jgi:hypothetical protein